MTNHQPHPLAPEELSQLHEIREVLITTATPGWAIITKRMKQDADDAQEELLGAAFATDTALAGLARRWQQRTAVYRAMMQYIASCTETKQLLLEQTEERGVPSYAE